MLIADIWITLAPTQKCLINFWIFCNVLFSWWLSVGEKSSVPGNYRRGCGEIHRDFSIFTVHWCLPDPRNYVSKSLECPILLSPYSAAPWKSPRARLLPSMWHTVSTCQTLPTNGPFSSFPNFHVPFHNIRYWDSAPVWKGQITHCTARSLC